jgi:hypothetical protein
MIHPAFAELIRGKFIRDFGRILVVSEIKSSIAKKLDVILKIKRDNVQSQFLFA